MSVSTMLDAEEEARPNGSALGHCVSGERGPAVPFRQGATGTESHLRAGTGRSRRRRRQDTQVNIFSTDGCEHSPLFLISGV